MKGFRPEGVCPKLISYEVEDGEIKQVNFHGGCEGGLSGIATLVKGMSVQDAIDKLEGIQCYNKGTSCPDQLSVALKEDLENGEI